MSTNVPVRLNVNGVEHQLDVEPRLLLVHALRDNLGLTGTHVGCDTSNCGACTVHLDGKAVKSCTLLAVQADAAAPSNHVGQAIRRKEDPRLITGRARYVDDISLPGTLWAAFVRSPEAHAKIVSIDASAAKQRPGIQAVFTGQDLSDLGGPLPMAWVPPGVEVNNPEHWPLAKDAVRHVGDPVAVVLGTNRYGVIDA